MKKKLKLLFLAVLIGAALAYITYKKFEINEVKSKVLAYQVGAYSEYNNALTKAKTLKGSIIMNVGDTYQVIAAIANQECSKKIEEMLNNENISYYKKELTLKEEALETLDYYELAIKNTENVDTLTMLNQKLLEEIEERMK